jgi:hypothetical protein
VSRTSIGHVDNPSIDPKVCEASRVVSPSYALVILGIIVIRTGPDIEPVRASVHWFTGPTVKNRLNRWFDYFRPDELNRSKIFRTGAI